MGFSFSDIIKTGGAIANQFFGDKSRADAARETNEQKIALAQKPFTTAFGDKVSNTGVEPGGSTRDLIAAIAASRGTARDAGEAFQTSGFFDPSTADPNNPFNRFNARGTIEADNQRLREAFINPALEQFRLASVRQGRGPETSNFGTGLQNEVTRLNQQFQLGDEQDILDFIIKNTLGVQQSAQGLAGQGQQQVPVPAANPAVGIANNLTSPGGGGGINSALSALGGGATSLIEQIEAREAIGKADAREKRALDILERLVGDQRNQQTSPIEQALLSDLRSTFA